MTQLTRLLRLGRRFVFERRYRNHILDLVNRHTQGGAHADVAPTTHDKQDGAFLQGRRIFIAAGCEFAYVLEHLEGLGMTVAHSHREGRAADPLTELMLPGSRALSEPWDYYLFAVSHVLRHLIHRVQTKGVRCTRAELDDSLAEVLDNYRQAIALVRQKSPAPIFLFSYVLEYRPTYGLHEYRSTRSGYSLAEFWHLFHLRLYEVARESDGVYILDAEHAFEAQGKSAVIDPAASTGVFDHYTRHGGRQVAIQLVRHLAALDPKRRRIKCAVLDLDNTLWSGVLREDGPTGVAVYDYHLDLLELLAARGILLAVCSKNDEAERAHLPGLLGLALYAKLASIHLSWKPKSEVLKDIAEELNIGLDSLALFDDSPFEREEVAANAPEVLVLTPEQIFTSLKRDEFEPVGALTEEALSRTVRYQQQAERKEAQRTATGLHDFLRSCDLQLELRPPEPGELSRVFELLQRTNQLNATLSRTSLDQLKQYVAEPARYTVRIARLKDKFGDYGLIGLGASELRDAQCQMLELAFSCRAMGRGVEKAMLCHLAEIASERGARTVGIQFTYGPRNQQMLELLKECGFAQLGAESPADGKTAHLEWPLMAPSSLKFPDWLKVDRAN